MFLTANVAILGRHNCINKKKRILGIMITLEFIKVWWAFCVYKDIKILITTLKKQRGAIYASSGRARERTRNAAIYDIRKNDAVIYSRCFH